jgi:putative hemolysin
MNVPVSTAAALLGCLLLSAFFSSSETALLSVRRLRLRQMAAEGHATARLIEAMLADVDGMLGAILIGNNLVNVAITALATSMCLHLFGEAGVAYATGIVTVVLLIFGEVTPKGVAARYPAPVALFVARPIDGLRRILHPLVVLLTKISRWLTAWLPPGEGAGRAFTSPTELQTLIQVGEAEGILEAEDAHRLHGVFALATTRVREIMVPRTDMITLPAQADADELARRVEEQPHASYPVEGDGGEIVGIVAARDILLAARSSAKFDLPATMAPPTFVPESKRIATLLEELRQEGRRMVIVADEYGDITGLATYTDIVEEITGTLPEAGAADIVSHADGSVQLDASLDIGQINRRLDWDLPEGDGQYDTLAGLIITCLGHLPEAGECISCGEYEMTVVTVTGRRLRKVRIRRHSPPAASNEAAP